MCFALSSCGGKAAKPLVISVAQGTVQVPDEVHSKKPFKISGQFEDANGNLAVGFPVYIKVSKEFSGKTLMGASASAKVVKASKSTRWYEGEVDAPSEPGEWHVQAFALTEPIGECSLTVK